MPETNKTAISDLSKNWDEWARIHPDSFSSVQRSKDPVSFQEAVQDIILKMDLKKEDSILDAGCGSGLFLEHLHRLLGIEGVGVDFSRELIGLAKSSFPAGNYRVGSVVDLPLEDESFDKVLCYGVMCHVGNWQSGIDELLRACRKGGTVFITDLQCRHLKRKYHICRAKAILKTLAQGSIFLRSLTQKRISLPDYWISLDEVTGYIEKKGHSVTVHRTLASKQWGSNCLSWDVSEFRRDLIIYKR